MANDRSDSPIAVRLVNRAAKLLQGTPEVIAADYGVTATTDFRATSAGDSARLRSFRHAQNRAITTFSGEFDRTRMARYNDYREMADEVPELSKSLDVLCDFVFGGDGNEDVRLIFGDTTPENVRDTLQAAWTSLDMPRFLFGAFREGIHLGDSFSELVYTSDQLVAEKPMRSSKTSVVWDDYGRVSGYQLQSNTSTFASLTGTTGLHLNPWQVVHYAPDQRRGHKYGRSTWVSARKIWRQSQSALDVLSILAILRAAARKSVTFPIPAGIREDEVGDFVQSLKTGGWKEEFFDGDGNLKKRIAAMLELDDLIYPYREGGEKPSFFAEPDADLRQLVEVQRYYQESYFVATGVPAALCGLERNINSRATLEQQGLHFVRTVRRRQAEVRNLAHDVLGRACLAASIIPEPDHFEVIMPPVSAFDEKLRAEVERLKAETAKILGVDVGLDLRWVYTHVLGMSDDDANNILENITELWWSPSDKSIIPDQSTQTKLAQSRSVEEALRGVAEAYTLGRENVWGLANQG